MDPDRYLAAAESLATGQTSEEALLWSICETDFLYFLENFVYILSESGGEGRWIPFHLWDSQRPVARDLTLHRLIVILKARQLGMTWLVLAFALWLLIFHPIATILLFSRGLEKYADTLVKTRLCGMHDHLPKWMQVASVRASDTEWELANGSRAIALAPSGGDSYTCTLVIVDEADLIPHFDKLMAAVKPTIDAGGRMIVLSRPDKGKPASTFKNLYRAARKKLTEWFAVFLPWTARPDRDAAWYEKTKASILESTQSLDFLHEHYPANEAQALAPNSKDKRISQVWLQQCWHDMPPLEPVPSGIPAIPGLKVFREAQPGRKYVLGIDTCEGNPTSDDSSIEVMDTGNGEEVASIALPLQPAILGDYGRSISNYFNRAPAMVERNNHGHAVIMWLKEHAPGVRLLAGEDGKDGWLSSNLGKTILYAKTTDQFRNGEVILHDFDTFTQLGSIEGSTLKAPEGEHDDRATGWALCCVGRLKAKSGGWGKSGKGSNATTGLPAGVLG